MTPKRRDYTLLEMLAVMAAMVIVLGLAVKSFRALASDIPRANRDFQAWIQTQGMLDRLKHDVEQAVWMQLTETDSQQGRLVLSGPAGQVTYTRTGTGVIRETSADRTVWDLPRVEIDWRLWRPHERPYALEISTWTERMVHRHMRKHYEQSFVFFMKTTERNHEE